MDSSEATIYHAVILASIILGGLFAVLVAVILRSQRRFLRLQRRRMLREVQLLEDERMRIARDLHDEIGPNLTVTNVLLSESLRNEKRVKAFIVQAQKNLSETNRRMGEIARNLTPAALASKGLDAAIKEFLGQIEMTGKISIRYVYRVSQAISPTEGLHIYRMVQELVNNALKHAEATQLEVQLKERKQNLYILCRDNGKGMVFNQSDDNRKGLGMASLQNRADMLGGKMQVNTGNGTEYFIALPINLSNYERNDTPGDS